MAHDLILKDSARGWARGTTMGAECTEQPRSHMGWFGYTMAAMFATRILSGRWPWYWAGLAGKRIEKGSR